MKRGVVVEYNDDYVTLLTPDGQFIKANNKEGNYEVGAEISFFSLLDEREEAATRVTRIRNRSISDYFKLRKARIGALSVLAIMVFMLSFLPFFNNDKVYAYMSIDINPSFEIGIDDELKVISLDPLNEEAEKLLEMLPEWENKQFAEIVTAIVAASKTEGYVYPGKEVVITTVIKEEDKDVQTKLEENIDEIRTSYENEEMLVNTIESDTETREKAQKLGISTGKYLRLQEKAKATDESKEDEIKPVEKENQSEDNSTTNKANNSSSSLNPANDNSQSSKEAINSDTKEKLQETKNKLQENSRNNNNEKKQEENKQKQQNQYIKEEKKKKKEEKNSKDYRNNKDDGDGDDRDNRNKRNDQDDRDEWDNRNKRNDQDDRDEWDNRNKRNDQDDRDEWDNRDKRNDRDDWDNRDKRNDRDHRNDRDKREDEDDN
jgi:hypothetical protein